MKVLVLGSGGREHAIAWKLESCESVEKVILHPGNAGTHSAGLAHWGELSPSDLVALIKRAEAEQIDLVVIGPEMWLAEGYGDSFRRAGFAVVGPGREASQLETSKVFSKKFMDRAGIPTAAYTVVTSAQELLETVKKKETWPQVLKLDGLAAGKGVTIAKNISQAEEFAAQVWELSKFGAGPHEVVVEDFVQGREISYIGMCDGDLFLPLPTATDYKRVGNGNQGANTGGMGCVSPSPYITPEIETVINRDVIGRVLAQMEADKLDYRGVLYAGIMLQDDGSVSVLEFNARFGDPETQATLPRLESDFGELLMATAKRELRKSTRPQISSRHSVFVVSAAKGYPEAPQTGDCIESLDAVDKESQLFYAGVKTSGDKLLTSGGRVLGIGSLAETLDEARKKTYANVKRISFEGMHFRSDIGEFDNADKASASSLEQ